MSKQSDALKRFNLLAAEIDSYYHMAAVKKRRCGQCYGHFICLIRF